MGLSIKLQTAVTADLEISLAINTGKELVAGGKPDEKK